VRHGPAKSVLRTPKEKAVFCSTLLYGTGGFPVSSHAPGAATNAGNKRKMRTCDHGVVMKKTMHQNFSKARREMLFWNILEIVLAQQSK
jgi:hypothetical protein